MSPGEARSGSAAAAAGERVDEQCGGRPADSRRSRTTPRAAAPYAVEVARVLVRNGSEALIEIDGRQVPAGIAIPPPAMVDAGDLVVVIGGAPDWWVVGTLGVLSAPGDAAPPAFNSATDLRLHAPRGRIGLAAARIRIGGGTASVFASTLRATARSSLLRCHTGSQWVAGRVTRTLGGLFQRITGDYHRRSREIDARADGPVAIKGSRIRFN